MKAIKPMSLGILHKPYRFAQSDRLVILGIGFFPLGGKAQGFLPEQQAWPQVLKRIPAEQVLDMVMPKPHGEVLAAACAYSSKPTREMEVRLQVAGVDKRLRVCGNREWFYSALPLHGMTEFTPFTVMPIDYSRAYGGPDHDGNPLGRGYTGRLFGYLTTGNRGAMPNIEYPERKEADHFRKSPPAGFGPLDLRWSPRIKKAGTYDKRWLEEESPGLPRDIDWSVFNAAPEDQQLPGFFSGGEAYQLEGMHPEKSVIAGNLPDMRLRAFLSRQSGALAEEVPMVFDTVWFFPDAEIGVALYRGEAAITRSDAGDVEALLLAYENNGDHPRTAEHYREALALRVGEPKKAIMHLANEAPLKPEPNRAEKARRAEEQKTAEEDYLKRSQALIDAAAADMAEHGDLPGEASPPKASLPPFGVLPKAALARGEADLSDMFAKIDAKVEELKKEGKERLKELAEKELRETIPEQEEKDDCGEAISRANNRPFSGMIEALEEAAEGEAKEAVEKLAGSIAKLNRDGRRAALKPVPTPLSPQAAKALGAEVRRMLAAGDPLNGRDLAGADLRGIDLSGADLRDVLLERADLSNANLSNADLSGAVLTGAKLCGADLSGAKLDNAGLNGVDAREANLQRARGKNILAFGASLEKADLRGAAFASLVSHRADFSKAQLDQSELTKALFLELSAADSSWRGAKLDQPIMLGADLSRARMEGAKLKRAVLSKAKAGKVSLENAEMENCFFYGADLSGGKLDRASARESSWRKGKLDSASLAAGSFENCDFGDATFSGANLRETRWNGSILSGARMKGCDGRNGEFFQAQCRMTDFSNADLSGARFMQADLSEAVFSETRLVDARHLPSKMGGRK